jgi:hypothetical protein
MEGWNMNAFEIILLLVVVGGVTLLFVNNLKKWNKQKDAKEKGLIKFSAIYTGLLKHIEGLPIASGTIIEFFYGKQKITFKKENQEISLENNKIVSMDLVLGKDVKSQATTGAIAGKYLLGGLGGAALGAILLTTIYFVILYKKDDENKTILLDTTGSDVPFKKILDDFKSSHQTKTQSIEL